MGHGKCLYASMYGIAYRSDLDTFPTPGLLGYWPDTVLANKNSAYTFRNSSGTSLITEKLKKAAEYVGLSHKGIHDIGSSWFGPAHLIIKLSSMAVVLSKYLRVYMFGPGSFCRCATCTELPLECTWGSGPYAGTILLYAQELAINQIWDKNQYDSLNKVNVDASTTTDESVCANLHLHVFHGSDRFSKFEFVDGRYKEFNMTGLKLSKARDFAIFLALKSSGQGIGEQEVSARYSIGGDGSLANVCKMDADISSL
ncbi:uncharacterized protein LOC111716674 isoform X2 [Eurytemora carolleeae]|uniref:uncharacterized protein LOC111716674 isoform X2 n=1 Tax=Eurytemora carolleeae TaxID=1294199 RepID=UPI000C786544|nr:uncharacterized protein LOC111716674 isoform X2 [Eurytemora carolleeae]|eukprot:XP_023347923.1 uncharacterized protein LOC111716674 isoform X2 [Eurytemora affinis]